MVGGVDEEGVARNAKDGRDRVDSEENVRDLDHDQHKSQRRQQPTAVAPHSEACAVVGIAHRQQPAHEPDQRIPRDIDSSLSVKGHLYARKEQESAEEIKRPVKRFNEGYTNADHHTAQEQRAHNTPEHYTVLVSRWDCEIGKDEDKNEDVIDA